MNVSDPEKLGFCHQRLNRIEPRLRTYIDNGDIAGISTLVARRGQVVNRSLIGLMSTKNQDQNTNFTGRYLQGLFYDKTHYLYCPDDVTRRRPISP